MKKAFSLLLVLGLILTSTAQKRKKGNDLTVAQKTELSLKKMTLRLDLTERQQNRIRPLLTEKYAHFNNNHKRNKKDRKKLSSEERYAKKMQRLDSKIALKSKIREILNDKQYEKFEKSFLNKKRRIAKRRMKRKKKEDSHSRG